MDNKGITTIELILSFILVSIIIISMFNVVYAYKNKARIESVRNGMEAYKYDLTKVIQDDVTKNNLVSYTINSNTNITLTFSDGIKSLIIDNENNTIIYNEVKYPINIKDVLIENTIYFESCSTTSTCLKIDIPIIFHDLDNDYGIHIIASKIE